MMIVVARHQHDLAGRAQSLAQLGQDARSRGERVPDRPLAELDDVAQENQAVGVGQGGAQPGSCTGVLESVPPAAGPQVQVGDDEGAQSPGS
jgi:hypothetical protein